MAELEPRDRRVSRNRPASHTRLDCERWHLERRAATNRRFPSALHAIRRAVEHLEERRTVFTADMLRAFVLAPGRWILPEIDAAIDRLHRDGHLVEVTAARSERAVVHLMKKKCDAPGRFVIDGDRVERHLDAGTLNVGQNGAVNTLLLSLRHVCGADPVTLGVGDGSVGRDRYGDRSGDERPLYARKRSRPLGRRVAEADRMTVTFLKTGALQRSRGPSIR